MTLLISVRLMLVTRSSAAFSRSWVARICWSTSRTCRLSGVKSWTRASRLSCRATRAFSSSSVVGSWLSRRELRSRSGSPASCASSAATRSVCCWIWTRASPSWVSKPASRWSAASFSAARDCGSPTSPSTETPASLE